MSGRMSVGGDHSKRVILVVCRLCGGNILKIGNSFSNTQRIPKRHLCICFQLAICLVIQVPQRLFDLNFICSPNLFERGGTNQMPTLPMMGPHEIKFCLSFGITVFGVART